jgi:hypothetical protein
MVRWAGITLTGRNFDGSTQKPLTISRGGVKPVWSE